MKSRARMSPAPWWRSSARGCRGLWWRRASPTCRSTTRASTEPCWARSSSMSRTIAAHSRSSPASFVRAGSSPSRSRRTRGFMGRATSGRGTSAGTHVPRSSMPARARDSRSISASVGAFRSRASTIATSMSGTSTGTGPPGQAAATGTSSPPSERSSRSTGSSSASSAARWATSCSRLARSPKAVLWSAMAAYAAGFGALAALEHRAFETGRFDLGNITQAVWSTVEGRPLDVTELGGDQISRLGAHVDPFLALFTPLWLVWPSPTMLLVVQAAAIALGALPMFWLGRKHLGTDWAGVLCGLAYLVYPAVQWLALDEFHPVALACPLLAFALWYLDEDRLWASVPFGVLAALTKEEIPLVVAALGVWYAIAKGRRLAGTVIAVAGTATTALWLDSTAPIAPFLFAAAILGASQFVRRREAAVAILAFSLLAGIAIGPLRAGELVPEPRSEHDRIAERGLALIPPEAPVSSTNGLGGHLSERRRIHSFPTVSDSEWVAIDLKRASYLDRRSDPSTTAVPLAELLRSGYWSKVFDEDGIIVLRRTA